MEHIGMLRHKDPEVCGVNALSFHLVNRFDIEVSFSWRCLIRAPLPCC